MSAGSTLTPESDPARERGRRRDRLIATAILTSLGVRVVTGLASLATVAIMARHLSTSELGLVLTLVTVWFFVTGTTDLGVGGITTTRVAGAAGRDDVDEMRSHTDHALAVLGGLGGAVVVGGIGAAAYLPWSSWLTRGELPASVVVPAVLATFISAGLALVGAVGDAVLGGLQRQTAQQVRSALGVTVALPGCVLAAALNLPVWAFVVAMIGLPALASVLNTAWIMLVEYPHLRPRMSSLTAAEARSLLKVSGYLALMRIGDTMSAGTGTVVVAAVRGPSAAAVYGIATRIYTLGASVIQVAGTKVWPGIAEAIARRDVVWATRRYRQSVVLVGGASGLGALVLVLAGSTFARIWVGPELEPSRTLFFALGVMLVATCLIGQVVIILLAAERLRTSGFAFLAVIGPTVIGSIATTRAIGMTGAALVPALVYLFVMLPIIAIQGAKALEAVGAAGDTTQ